jgi:predicted HTH domain antitoxin
MLMSALSQVNICRVYSREKVSDEKAKQRKINNNHSEVQMPKQIKLNEIDDFSEVLSIPDAAISQRILDNVKKLDEEHEMEKYLRQIIFDPTKTPHGPTEIADILSYLHVKGEKKLAAFVLKGKSFKKVTSRDVSHQFFKLRSIPGLKLMVFAAVGDIHDDAKRDFFQAAKDAESECTVLNAHDLAKLFIAYKKICPKDGTSFDNSGVCKEGHKVDSGIRLEMEVGEKIKYSIFQQKDLSFGGAKRFAAQILIDKHYSKEVLRKIIKELTERLRKDTYCRNELVRERWGNSPAHVVWLHIGQSIEDLINSNWSCHSQWIDPLLEEDMRPLGLHGSELYDNIEIRWNEDYKKMESFFETHSGTKNEVLTVLFKLLDEMDSSSKNVISLFNQYIEGDISEKDLIKEMQKLAPKIDQIYNESGNVPLPPPDCKDFYQACQNIFASFQNMALYYSEIGLKQWKRSNRDSLMKMTVKSFLDEYEIVKFERKKLQ